MLVRGYFYTSEEHAQEGISFSFPGPRVRGRPEVRGRAFGCVPGLRANREICFEVWYSGLTFEGLLLIGQELFLSFGLVLLSSFVRFFVRYLPISLVARHEL